ncbi:GNAT family N-acetyltransferase [Kitasatospora sp. NPDC058965]|uniref:GNAT family N-acetyltransferase n=1 Tax=Kitasatospora sp. NPDC058965 TaxID=3346682 RepID=UPI0036CC2A4C
MTWTLSESVAEFQQHAGPFLRGRPVENTVLLTLAHQLAAGGAAGGDPACAPRFGWWRPGPGEPVAGAYAQTPPQPLRLGAMPARAAAELAEAVVGQEQPGVGGPVAAARAFADRWAELAGARVTVNQAHRLYRLAELAAPTGVAGRPRAAVAADTELLVRWFGEFFEQVGFVAYDVPGIVARRLAARGVFLWEDAAGRPVALAGLSEVLAGTTRIGQVYTPAEARGRGYASALVAEVSAVGRERGADEVLLFTDLANATSNSIYQRIGYRPVEDSLLLDFTAG